MFIEDSQAIEFKENLFRYDALADIGMTYDLLKHFAVMVDATIEVTFYDKAIHKIEESDSNEWYPKGDYFDQIEPWYRKAVIAPFSNLNVMGKLKIGILTYW